MNWVNTKISREDMHHLLDRFQISKTTGFSHDYKSTFLSTLATNLWLIWQDWCEIVMSPEDIEWAIQKLSIPYEQYLQDKLRKFRENMSQKYPDHVLKDISEDFLIPVLVSFVSQCIDEFNWDVSLLRKNLERYNNWTIPLEQVRENLEFVIAKFFPTVHCKGYSE